MSSNVMRDSARVIATELIREPVKQAVRDALHEEIVAAKSQSGEEAVTIKSTNQGGSSSQKQQSKQSSGQQSSGGGRSKLTIFGVILAIAGVAFLARRRMSSTSGSAWSEQSPGAVATDDTEGGYVSEGEMQTAETSEESGADTEGTGTSPSTTTDQ